LGKEIELKELSMDLNHLPVCWGQRLDVDGMGLRWVYMEHDANLLPVRNAQQPREYRIHLDHGYFLLPPGPCGSVSRYTILSYNWRQLPPALHTSPADKY
jgi:hypothetical protein